MGVTLPEKARYTFGGDEFLFVEVDEAMSLEANIRVMSIARGISEKKIRGLVELVPANASLLVRFDPDLIHPTELQREIEQIETEAKDTSGAKMATRIIEVPVWFQDPHTDAVVKRYREGYHQNPAQTDLEYSAEVNGLSSVEEFIQRYYEQPWLVSMVGFVAGLPFLYQLVGRDKQLEVPKYLSPRPGGTPQLTLGHGGCFGAVYSVEGAGGYQMLGILAGPIFDPQQKLPDFVDSRVFFRPGDIVKYRPVTGEIYEQLCAEVAAGTFRYKTVPFEFDALRALKDVEGYNRTILEALDGN